MTAGDRCELCPRRCKARRFGPSPEKGYCGALDAPRVFRYGPHFGEEPPICGEKSSGCIFFSRCTMKCVYCQNSPWSWKGGGDDMDVEGLASIMRKLAVEDGVGNWNLVSPTPYLPYIEKAADLLSREGVRLPFVWNSSGYERVETLERYRRLCDWALFDLRYSSDATAMKLSGAPDYVERAREALKWAWENAKGKREGEGGLIARILVIPGHADEAVESLAWMATELSPKIPVSIMSQYTPAYEAKSMPPLDRSVTEEEYSSVVDAAEDFGFANGWIQDMASSSAELALLGENMSAGHGPVRP